MKLAVLSNVNLDMLIGELGKSHTLFQAEGYGQWVSYALRRDEALSAFEPEVIFLMIDGNALLETCTEPEEGSDEIQRSLDFAVRLAENYPYSTVAVSNIDVRRQRIYPAASEALELGWEHEWETRLAEAAKRPNIVPFDLKSIIANEGRRSFYSEKLWYTGSIPYGIKSLKPLSTAMCAFAERLGAVRKKVLVLDLDNTLWGGVVGEDGPQGIVLGTSLIGAAYRDAQKRIKELAATGVLLAVVSKNNPEDVQAAFRDNAQMVLKESDFVSVKANWEPKHMNIRQLAAELNLGLDSFVFLDDNEVERESVRMNLPEVTVADFPKDIAMLPQAVSDIYEKHFWCARRTAEDSRKTQQYREEAQRKQAKLSAVSMDDYLLSLEMDIAVGPMKREQLERTVQLLNKTNQFNTNTLRMDMPQLMKYLEGGGRVYTASVSDRYGDSGLVSILLMHTQGDTAVIDNFLMSCRVMGRSIEDSILYAIGKAAEAEGMAKLSASFVPTAKNKPVEKLWDRLGFILKGDDGGTKQYELCLPAENKPLIGARWSE